MITRPKRILIRNLGLTGTLILLVLTLYQNRRKFIARILKLSPVLPDLRSVGVIRNIPVKTENGFQLMTDHYFPILNQEVKKTGNQASPINPTYPTILIRTPYGRGLELPLPLGLLSILIAQRFAERGYNVVVQTVRGRFDSTGEFEPRQNEREDGLATLAWLREQSWFAGQVGTWGQSYLGFCQWAIADSPLVKALVPSITSSHAHSVTYPDGVFGLDLALNWTYLISQISSPFNLPIWKILAKLNSPNREKILGPAFTHLPVVEADLCAVGHEVPFYRKWLKQPHPEDPYWQKSDNRQIVPHVTAPVHLVSGWYDFMLRELLADYGVLKENGKTPYLTIGPWFHVSPEGLLESLRSGINWFDAQLKGAEQRLRHKPVRYFVMGLGEWREADSWPPLTQESRYFLRENGELSRQMADIASLPDDYRYDPANPTPSVGGTLLTSFGGPRDNRELEARPDVLIYTTLPLTEGIEINGWVKLELFVKSSLAHTDFFGRLCDVYPDGRSLNVCDGLLRVEPGKGESQPDGSLKLEISLWATAQYFKRGHSIRLQVSSGAHPHWNRNPGTGEPDATASRLQVAEQLIYHDPTHPSALVLPVFNQDLAGLI